MRQAALRVAAAISFLGGSARVSIGQELPVETQLPLTRSDRIDLINSVLAERQRLFPSVIAVDGCSLADVIGATAAGLAGAVLPPFRAQVRGGSPDQCPLPPRQRSDTSISIVFRSIYYETNEHIPSPGPRVPTPPGLMVVRIWTGIPGERSQIEEWVMWPAREKVWTVRTIRLYGFGYH